MRGATQRFFSRRQVFDFNPRAPCGARQSSGERLFRPSRISTHAPLAGRDEFDRLAALVGELFQPTRPLRGATASRSDFRGAATGFQPTRPLRGATSVAVSIKSNSSYFNPRAPCGARQKYASLSYMAWHISTHAPLAGRDERPQRPCVFVHRISTHAPLAGRDWGNKDLQHLAKHISTHAPLAGRDLRVSVNYGQLAYFNPRAPCGARPADHAGQYRDILISTHAPLAGRDSYTRNQIINKSEISTHAPLAGRDAMAQEVNAINENFNPRAPCGARRKD